MTKGERFDRIYGAFHRLPPLSTQKTVQFIIEQADETSPLREALEKLLSRLDTMGIQCAEQHDAEFVLKETGE